MLQLLLLFPTSLTTKLSDSKIAASEANTLAQAHAIADWTIDVRRELHSQPELLYDLEKTSRAVRARLDELGIAHVHSIAKTGIVATIGTGKPPCVALRADMDALPIHEEIACPYKSTVDGKMHACGHDAHTAMLLAAGRYASPTELELLRAR